MDQEILKKNIAANITHYRKLGGLTQADLAAKINYSDKAVSKWERGDGIPDVAVLCEMAEIFGVTLNQLVSGDQPVKITPRRANKLAVALLSLCIVWLSATVINIFLIIAFPSFKYSWLPYIYGLFASSILLTVFFAVWKKRIPLFLSVSGIVWTSILSVFLTLIWVVPNMGFLFIAGAPLQIMATIWFFRPNAVKK